MRKLRVGGAWYNNLGDFNAAIVRNQIANRGGGFVQKGLKKTRILSRGLKFVGAKGSALHRFGEHLEQQGYGVGLVGRMYLV